MLTDGLLFIVSEVVSFMIAIGLLAFFTSKWKPAWRLVRKQFQAIATETNSGTYLMDHINGISEKLDRLAESHDQHATTVYERFADGSANFDRLDRRMDATEQRTSKIEGQLDVLIAAPRAAALAAMDTEDAEVERLIG